MMEIRQNTNFKSKLMDANMYDASIIIRTYNEAKLIGELLKTIFNQKTSKTFEVIVVDSESTDNTVAIAKQFPVKIITIKKADFTYGRSLNRGIEQSKGKYILVVSGHCIPVDENWIEQLLKPIELNKDVGLCYGRQQGIHQRHLGYPSTRFSERVLFQQQYPENCNTSPYATFLNNANSAFTKKLWTQINFDEDLPGLEDLDFAIKAKQQFNLESAYVPTAPVLHIHDENNGHVFKRFLREERAYLKIHQNQDVSKTVYKISSACVKDLYTDFKNAYTQNGLKRFFRTIIGFRLAQYFGIYWAHFEPVKNKSKFLFMHNTVLSFITRGRYTISSKDLIPTVSKATQAPTRVLQQNF